MRFSGVSRPHLCIFQVLVSSLVLLEIYKNYSLQLNKQLSLPILKNSYSENLRKFPDKHLWRSLFLVKLKTFSLQLY